MIKYTKVEDEEVPIEVASASWERQETATLLVTLYKVQNHSLVNIPSLSQSTILYTCGLVHQLRYSQKPK